MVLFPENCSILDPILLNASRLITYIQDDLDAVTIGR
jgi:hypothetical protein